nr:MAG TPA: minor capsid protein [Microviridae sp.]
MAIKTEGDKGSDMGWGSVIGAVAGVGGGLLGNYLNSREMRKQREWMERMSNTAHQREVDDLRNAGLNPVLSATGGNGASTPQGQLIPMEDPIEKGINSALAIRQQESTIGLQDAQAAQAGSQTQLNTASAKQAEEQAKLLQISQDKVRKEMAEIDARIKNLDAGAQKSLADAKFGSGSVGSGLRVGNSLWRQGVNFFSNPNTLRQMNTLYNTVSDAASELGTSVSNILGQGKAAFRKAAFSAFSNLSNNRSGSD